MHDESVAGADVLTDLYECTIHDTPVCDGCFCNLANLEALPQPLVLCLRGNRESAKF